MNVKKIVVGGTTAALFSIILSMLTCGGLFSWVYELEPTNVWKPMGESGPGTDYLLGFFFLTLVLAYVYAVVRASLPGKNKIVKGLVFGLGVWAIGMLPGMLATYAFMTVSPTVILYWTVLGLVETPVKGMIIAAVYGEG